MGRGVLRVILRVILYVGKACWLYNYTTTTTHSVPGTGSYSYEQLPVLVVACVRRCSTCVTYCYFLVPVRTILQIPGMYVDFLFSYIRPLFVNCVVYLIHDHECIRLVRV